MRNFRKEWVLEGMLKGYDYDGFSGISEGMSLSNGDLVMVGASSTGHFSLGEVKIDYANGAGSFKYVCIPALPRGKAKVDQSHLRTETMPMTW